MTEARSPVGCALRSAARSGEVADEVEHDVDHRRVLARPSAGRVLGSEELLGQLEHLLAVLLRQSDPEAEHTWLNRIPDAISWASPLEAISSQASTQDVAA